MKIRDTKKIIEQDAARIIFKTLAAINLKAMNKFEIKTLFKMTEKIGLILIVLIINISELKSQDISTNRDIYDYEVGDIFHYYSDYAYPWFEGWEDVTNIEIIGKYYSAQNDTLNYIRNIQYKKREYDSPGNYDPWTYEYYTDTICYSDLDSLVNDGLIDIVYSDPNLYNGRIINEAEFDSPNYHHYFNRYVIGCGLAVSDVFDYGFSSTHNIRLQYYKKGDEEGGDPLPVSIDKNEFEDKLLIFPNPCESSLNIRNNFQTEGYLDIYSIFGNKIEKLNIKNKLVTFELSFLKPGIYILDFNFNGHRIKRKIIKK